MKGELRLVDELSPFSDNEFEVGTSLYGFKLNIYVDDTKTLEKQLKNKETFYKEMDAQEAGYRAMDFNDKEVYEEINYMRKHFDTIMDSVEFIKLSFEKTNEKEYITKNPIIKTKKIVLDIRLKLTETDRMVKLLEEYRDIKDIVYIYLDGNMGYVSLNDAYKTMLSIQEQAEKIKKLNLSPMETIMYVYDQVRYRTYASEEKGESYLQSRDLSNVLFGDKIVCVGYSRIFASLLKCLGITVYMVGLLNKAGNDGHERNSIYVKDDKYGIDGFYYFDATWASRDESTNNNYLYNYQFFAKTKSYMDKFKKYVEERIPIYSENMFDDAIKAIENKDTRLAIQYINSLNAMSIRILGYEFMPYEYVIIPNGVEILDIAELKGKFERIYKKFNTEIPGDVMLRVFNNVRKIEYYQNSELYPYTLSDIYATMKRSDWKLPENEKTNAAILLACIFGESESEARKEEFKIFCKDNEITDDVTGVRLTKVLQLVRDKKIIDTKNN